METRLIVANMEIKGEKARVTVLARDQRPVEIDISYVGQESRLDNIYVGHVENVSAATEGWFVKFSGEEPGYLSFARSEHAVLKYAGKDGQIRAGSELLVQVYSDAVKTKRTALTGTLSIKGKHVLVQSGPAGVFYSRKLTAAQKKAIKEILDDCGLSENFAYVIRTSAAGVSAEELAEDIRTQTERMEYITRIGVSRPWGTCLYKRKSAWLEILDRVKNENIVRIVTDDTDVYDELRLYLADNAPDILPKLEFYSDSMVELFRLHKLSTLLDHCISNRVWLPSGACIVIEQTEAFVSIDVNTGKIVKKTADRDLFYKVNLEAAKEIARQIRLRNLSGTILVDFINMKKGEQEKELLEMMQAAFADDPVKTEAVDITKLGIMEITRKKTRRSLKEQLAGSSR